MKRFHLTGYQACRVRRWIPSVAVSEASSNSRAKKSLKRKEGRKEIFIWQSTLYHVIYNTVVSAWKTTTKTSRVAIVMATTIYIIN